MYQNHTEVVMTKKVLSALCVFFILSFLCGCDSPNSKTVVTEFSADFTANYRDMELKGKITADRRGILSIELDSPETLSGVAVTYKNGETELKRDDLICTADEAYLPNSSFPALLKSAFKTLGNNDKKPKNGTLVIEDDGKTYEFSIDENGYIKKLTADGELEMEFDNIKKLG